MQANFDVKKVVCLQKLKQTVFSDVEVLNISNLPEFAFKQFGTQLHIQSESQ